MILIYSQTFLPDLGGLERNTFTLAQALKENTKNICILTDSLRETDEDLKVKVVRTKSNFTRIWMITKSKLIIVNGGLSLKVCVPAIIFRKKYIIIYQSSTIYLRPENSKFAKINNKIRQFFANNAAVNLGVSDFATSQLKLLKPSAFTLVNPIDEQLNSILQFCNISKNKLYDLLFAGRIITGKGVFILAETLLELQNEGYNLICAFAGDGEMLDELKLFCKQNQINAIFLGRLDKVQLIEAYSAAKILVVPSSTHIEGNPLVIAEALTCGTPIIASNQAAMVEAVGNAGRIFDSYSAIDLKIKIIDLLFNHDGLNKASLATINQAKQFSYDVYQKKIINIVNSNIAN